MSESRGGDPEGLRLDKWLFYARIFKSRALAVERIEAGGVRVNAQPCAKPGRLVRPGDRVTVSAHGKVQALEIVALGRRRGPAPEAQALYLDLMAAEGRDPGSWAEVPTGRLSPRDRLS